MFECTPFEAAHSERVAQRECGAANRLCRRISSSLGCSTGCLLGRQRLGVEFDLRGRAYQNLLEARDRLGLRKQSSWGATGVHLQVVELSLQHCPKRSM